MFLGDVRRGIHLRPQSHKTLRCGCKLRLFVQEGMNYLINCECLDNNTIEDDFQSCLLTEILNTITTYLIIQDNPHYLPDKTGRS